MLRRISILMLGVLGILFCYHSSIQAHDGRFIIQLEDEKQIPMISLQSLSEKELQALTDGSFCQSGLVIECPAGSYLPICLSVESDFLQLDANSQIGYTLHFLKPFYIQFNEERLLFSQDLTHWHEWQTFIQGKLCIGLTAREGFHALKIGLEANLK